MSSALLLNASSTFMVNGFLQHNSVTNEKAKTSLVYRGKKRDAYLSHVKVQITASKKDIYLVLVYGITEHPMMLATNKEIHSKEDVINVAKTYFSRWRIEEYFRCKKQMFQFENFCVRKLAAINALNFYITLCMAFLAHISMKSESNALKAAIIQKADAIKEKVHFCYYRLAKGITGILSYAKEGGYGEAKIAKMLNEKGLKTKRNCDWSQNAVCRILTNELYTGKIINGKQEVAAFLTGQRKDKEEDEWLLTTRPELRIIEDEVFDKAQEILKGRHTEFNLSHERQSNKYLFSTLIKCKDCGWPFRRTVRQYKNTYVRWVCSGHNGNGADSCPNAVTVDEEELIQVLQEYFNLVLSKKKKVIDYVVKEFQRVYKAKDENVEYKKN